MSYILNALRKSEQERRIEQTPTLENGILNSQARQYSQNSWLIPGIIIFNLIALGLFYWFNKQQDTPVTQADTETVTTHITAVTDKTDKAGNAFAASKKSIISHPVTTDTTEQQASISAIVNNKKNIPPKDNKASVITENSSSTTNNSNLPVEIAARQTPLTSIPETNKPSASASRASISKQQQSAIDKSSPVTVATVPVQQTPMNAVTANEKDTDKTTQQTIAISHDSKLNSSSASYNQTGATTDSGVAQQDTKAKYAGFTITDNNKQAPQDQTKPPQNDVSGNNSLTPADDQLLIASRDKQGEGNIPLLKELSYSFRRKIPRLDINVYVYADAPQDRFIMVDMIKYSAGEQIADKLLLKEIMADSLLVEFEGKTFRIERP